MRHTDCGLTKATDEQAVGLVESKTGAKIGDQVHFYCYPASQVEQQLRYVPARAWPSSKELRIARQRRRGMDQEAAAVAEGHAHSGRYLPHRGRDRQVARRLNATEPSQPDLASPDRPSVDPNLSLPLSHPIPFDETDEERGEEDGPGIRKRRQRRRRPPRQSSTSARPFPHRVVSLSSP